MLSMHIAYGLKRSFLLLLPGFRLIFGLIVGLIYLIFGPID